MATLEEVQPTFSKVACPNPGCKGMVLPTDSFCLRCGHSLAPCPNCKHVMSENVGTCPYCGYNRASGTVSPTEEQTASRAAERPPSSSEAAPRKTPPQGPPFQLTSAEVVEILAQAYQAAARANANMRSATEAFETARVSMLGRDNLLTVWDVLSQQIGLADAGSLQSALCDLRRQVVDLSIDREVARLHDVFERDRDAGWREFLYVYATALASWRVEICVRLAAERFPCPVEDPLARAIQQCTRWVDHLRWAEAYDLFVLLGEQEGLPPITRARILVAAGEIQLYYLLQYPRALEHVQTAVSLAPDDGRVVYGLGEYWLERNDLEQAKEAFQRAVHLSPRQQPGYVGMGEWHEKAGTLAAAEEWYQEAIRADPGDSAGYRSLLRLYGRPELIRSHQDKLQPLIDRAIAVDPSDEYSTYASASYLYRQSGEQARAVEWLQRAIALEPDRPLAYYELGYTYLEAKQYDQAHTAFEKSTQVAPEALDGYWGMALLYEQQEEWEEALLWFRKSLERRPTWEVTIKAKIGQMLVKLAKYQDGEAAFLQALRSDPDNESLFNHLLNLADLYYRTLDDSDAALRVYAEIRGIKGQSFEAEYHNRVGNLNYYNRRYADAAEAYRTAIAVEPDTAVYHSNLSLALREIREWDGARQEANAAYNLMHDDAVYQKDLSLIDNIEGNDFYARSDYQTAIEKYRGAIAHDPSEPVFHSNLALAWENLQSPPSRLEAVKAAASALEDACRLAPTVAEYAERLTRLTEKIRFASHFGEQTLEMSPRVLTMYMDVSWDLLPYVEGDGPGGLSEELTSLTYETRDRVLRDFGVPLPALRFRASWDLPAGSYAISLDDSPRARGSISRQKKLFSGAGKELALLGIEGEATTDPVSGAEAYWIDEDDWERVEAAGFTLWDLLAYPMRHLEAVARQNLSDLIGHDETMTLLGTEAPNLQEEMRRNRVALAALTTTLQALLKESVPITPLAPIVEEFSRVWDPAGDPGEVVESIRSLPDVRSHLPGNDGRHSLLTLDPSIEAEIQRAIRREDHHRILVLEPDQRTRVADAIQEALDSVDHPALLVESQEVRPFVRRLIQDSLPHVPVLSRGELHSPMGSEVRLIGRAE